MFYITKDCTIARTILKSNLYKIVVVNTLLVLLSQDPTKNISGFVDGYIIDEASFDFLNSKYGAQLGSMIHDNVTLFVISKKSYSLSTGKIVVVSTKEQLLKRIDVSKVTPLSDTSTVVKVEPLSIEKKEEKVEETVQMPVVQPVQQEPIQQEQPVQEPIQQEQPVKQEQPAPMNRDINIEHKISLQNLNLYDLIRVAYTQNEKFKTLKDQLRVLRGELKNLNSSNMNEMIDRYMKQEDDACIELVNEFKLLVKDVLVKYEVTMDSRVNNLYDQVVEVVSKEMYGLTQESITALMRKKASLMNELRDCLSGILNDFSNVQEVSSDLARLIQPFNFNTDNDADLPLIYNGDNLNNTRLELYKELVQIKMNSDNANLIDRIKVAMALIEDISLAHEDLTMKAISTSPFVLQTTGVDLIYDTGKNTYSVLKTILLKNKLLSLNKIVVIDITGLYGKIQEFDNNIEYTNVIPQQSDELKNYIIIDKTSNYFSNANNIFIPVSYKMVKDARSYANSIMQENPKVRACMVLTPGSYELYDKLGTENLVIIPYIQEYVTDEKYDDIKNMQDIYKTILKLR